MSINYIKENIKKFDHDNLISFLFDIVIRGGLDDIEDFDESKTYYENEKIYYKDVKNIHHIYKCVVEIATPGRIINDEWIDLLESFRKPVIGEETFVSEIEVKEEVVLSTENNQTEFVLTTPGVVDDIYTVILFHPEHGRLAKSDYYISGQTIILDDEYAVTNIGEKLIVDLYRKN